MLDSLSSWLERFWHARTGGLRHTIPALRMVILTETAFPTGIVNFSFLADHIEGSC